MNIESRIASHENVKIAACRPICRAFSMHMQLAAAVMMLLAAAVSFAAARRYGAEDGPNLRVIPECVDLRTVLRNSAHAAEFRLHNAGSFPLEVMSLESSCACTEARLDTWRIAPGTSATLRVMVSTGSSDGPLMAKIGVVYRTPASNLLRRLAVRVAGIVSGLAD